MQKRRSKFLHRYLQQRNPVTHSRSEAISDLEILRAKSKSERGEKQMKDPKDKQTIDAFEKKAMTGAERQAKLREARKNKARIDCYISKESKDKLDRLRAGFSIEQMLEKLIDEEYRELEDNPMLKLSESEQREAIRKMAEEDQAHYDSLPDD